MGFLLIVPLNSVTGYRSEESMEPSEVTQSRRKRATGSGLHDLRLPLLIRDCSHSLVSLMPFDC